MENAFMLLATWNKRARRSGWSDTQIESVLKEAESSDYDHLVETLERNEI